MNRYYVIWQQAKTQGEIDKVIVYDKVIPEPVCIIFPRFFPHAVDVILKALNQHEKEKYIEPIIEKNEIQ
jgi:hypothetical protein